ncbi:hypothetical protein DKY63_31660 [Pseudomonas putida]|uniref:Uncharacterized protein n=1 Tax=Pseudomonas putida TaxID=303 RepID=A0A2Z4RSQ6_PSEPU|nr:hypothetical protein [Pseudomonas putida]AWY44223.1 hypothetical protein DKY63_31660 [Pseudomonas putida]
MNINGSIGNHIYNAGTKHQKTNLDNQSTTRDVLPAQSPKSTAAGSDAFSSNFNEAVAKAHIHVVTPQPIRLMSKAEVDTRLQHALTGTRVAWVDETKIIAGE